MKRRVPAILAASALALGAVQATAPAASAKAAGEDSLAALLTSDGNTFDKNKNDFDIVTEAALAIVAAKPDSPVALLADGSQRLTVFAPTDEAFRLLAKDLTGKTIKSEKKIFDALVDLAGVDTIETVLLYHVVPGKTLTSNKVLKANGAKLTTAQGGKITVKVKTQAERERHAQGPATRTPRTRRPCSRPSTSTRATSRSPTASTGCSARSTSEARQHGRLTGGGRR